MVVSQQRTGATTPEEFAAKDLRLGRTPTTTTRPRVEPTPIILRAPIPTSALELTAAAFTEPLTFLKSPTEAIDIVRERRARIQLGDVALQRKVTREIVTKAVAGLTAVGLGATGVGRGIAKVVGPKLIPTTPIGILGATTGAGLLVTSPTIRKGFTGFLRDPTGFGAEGGIAIEKLISGEDVGSIGGLVKTAGLIGLGVGGVALGKEVLGKFKEGKTISFLPTPSDVPGSVALPPSVIPTALSPITDKPVVAETPKPVLPVSDGKEINIKVINKPQVNVAVAQSS